MSYVCPAFAVSYALALYSFVILGDRDLDVVETLTGGLWYLKALAIFVCLQAVLVRCRRIWMELFIIALMEVVFLAGWKTCPLLHRLFCLEHCFFFYPFFMLGYYTRRYNWVEFVKARNWVFTIALVGLVCLLNAHFDIHAFRFLSERIVRPICAILVITYLFAIRENVENRFEKWLNRIGTKTLDIYMYHGLFLDLSYGIFNLRNLKDSEMMNSNPVSFLLIALLLTLLLTYASMAIGMLVRKSTVLEKVVYGKFIR